MDRSITKMNNTIFFSSISVVVLFSFIRIKETIFSNASSYIRVLLIINIKVNIKIVSAFSRSTFENYFNRGMKKNSFRLESLVKDK